MAKKRLQYPGEICRPEEKIIERVEIEPFRSAHVPSVEFASATELARLIRPMTAPTPPRPVSPPPEIQPMLVQEIKNKQYKNFTVDLSVARTNAPLGLRDMAIVADAMTIASLTAGATLNYRLNNPANDLTPASQGLQETEFEIEEVYLTNVAQAPGTQAVIRVNWNPFLIRLKP